MRKIRVLVVDDSVVIRRLLTDILSADPDIELAGTAPNGRIALAKLPQLNPDIVTLDIEMPDLDGLSTLPELRKAYPKLPVIMFSTLTERGALSTLDALARGATDYVTKPANVGSVAAAIQSVRDQLIPKIKALCPLTPPPAVRVPINTSSTNPTRTVARFPQRCDVVVIGSSTGGPQSARRRTYEIAGLLSGTDRRRSTHAAGVHASLGRAAQSGERAHSARSDRRRDAAARSGADRSRQFSS